MCTEYYIFQSSFRIIHSTRNIYVYFTIYSYIYTSLSNKMNQFIIYRIPDLPLQTPSINKASSLLIPTSSLNKILQKKKLFLFCTLYVIINKNKKKDRAIECCYHLILEIRIFYPFQLSILKRLPRTSIAPPSPNTTSKICAKRRRRRRVVLLCAYVYTHSPAALNKPFMWLRACARI